MDFTNNPILTLIQQAMGLGSRGGAALADAIRNSPGYGPAPDGQRTNNTAASVMPQGIPNTGGRFVSKVPKRAFAPARPGSSNPVTAIAEALGGLPDTSPDNRDIGGGDNTPMIGPAPIQEAMAAQAGPDMTPDNRDIGGGDNTPMMAPVSDAVVSPVVQRSFIERVMDNSRTGVSPVEYIFRGLGAAGSPDPMKVMAQYAQQDTERDKLRTESELAKKPKVVPLANGAFSLIINADGSTQVVKNDEVGQFLKDSSEGKFDREIMKLLIGKKADVEAANAKTDAKNAGDARQALQSTQALYDGWNKALEVVTEQAKDAPTMSKIQGAFPGISGFFGGDQVATNKFLQGLKVDETLLNTARTKGAISEKEMELFASPIPALSDDREKVWKPYIEQRLPVIKKLMEFQKAEAARGEGGADRVTGGLTPPPAPAPAASPAPAPAAGRGKAFTVPGLSEGASRYFNK